MKCSAAPGELCDRMSSLLEAPHPILVFAARFPKLWDIRSAESPAAVQIPGTLMCGVQTSVGIGLSLPPPAVPAEKPPGFCYSPQALYLQTGPKWPAADRDLITGLKYPQPNGDAVTKVCSRGLRAGRAALHGVNPS